MHYISKVLILLQKYFNHFLDNEFNMEILYCDDPTALNLKIQLIVWVNYYGFNLPYSAMVMSTI